MSDLFYSTVMMRRGRETDLPAITSLLTGAGLPTAGVADHLPDFLLAITQGGIVALAGLERYGRFALLRSVVVSDDQRGRGLGQLLVSRVIDRAKAGGAESVYLLTTTAADWFPRFGFVKVERAALPPELGASEELRGACPDTAVCMVLPLAK